MLKPGIIVCLVDNSDYPFIILRETKAGDIIFCLKDEIFDENNNCSSRYTTPKNFYHVISKDDENSIRGKIVSKRCYISEAAKDAFESEYGIAINPSRVKYAEIKPYLRYKEILIDYVF